MEISAKKTKLMTNNTSGISTEIKVNGQKLETVTSLKYLGSLVTDDCCELEILSRTAQTTAALSRLKPVWNDMNIHERMDLVCTDIFSMISISLSLFCVVQRSTLRQMISLSFFVWCSIPIQGRRFHCHSLHDAAFQIKGDDFTVILCVV